MNENLITSAQNPKFKRLQQLLQKSSERRQSGLFVVEGQRELNHCIAAGFTIDTLFICRELHGDNPTPSARHLYELSPSLYAKIAYRDTTEGIIAVAEERTLALEDLRLGESPLLVVLEKVEKPGNMGAILRSADAAGADAVIVCDPLTDLYNPNLIRSSIGAAFTVPCVAASSDECIAFLKQRGITILTAQLQDSELYYNTDMRTGVAIVMGTESTGLTNKWREAASAHIRIPMNGLLDSLNVSVSAAILLFEAVRQRRQ